MLFYGDVQKKWAPRYSKDDSVKSVHDFLWIIFVDVIQPNESEWVSITRTSCEKRRFSSLHVGDNITSHRGMWLVTSAIYVSINDATAAAAGFPEASSPFHFRSDECTWLVRFDIPTLEDVHLVRS